jgi:hypothetical protein
LPQLPPEAVLIMLNLVVISALLAGFKYIPVFRKYNRERKNAK